MLRAFIQRLLNLVFEIQKETKYELATKRTRTHAPTSIPYTLDPTRTLLQAFTFYL